MDASGSFCELMGPTGLIYESLLRKMSPTGLISDLRLVSNWSGDGESHPRLVEEIRKLFHEAIPEHSCSSQIWYPKLARSGCGCETEFLIITCRNFIKLNPLHSLMSHNTYMILFL